MENDAASVNQIVSRDHSTTIEENHENDFAKWKEDSTSKNIINNIIVDYRKKVTVTMISDSIAWNICNLKQPIDWNIPDQIIDGTAKVMSVQWIKNFKKYVMGYMKKQWETQFVRIFNLPKFNCLRTDKNTSVISFKAILEMTQNANSYEVSNIQIKLNFYTIFEQFIYLFQ